MSAHYSVEIKLDAVHKVLDDHIPVAKVAEELHIHRDTVYKWVHKYQEEGKMGLIDHRIQEAEIHTHEKDMKKIKSLEREIRRLKKENDILKKFQAYMKQIE